MVACAAVAREVTEDEVEVLHEPEPVVDVGDGRLLLRVELLAGCSTPSARPFVTVNAPDHLEVIRLLGGGEPVEPEPVPGQLRGLAAPERRLGLHATTRAIQ